VTGPARFKGIAASIGVAVGAARLVGREPRRISHRRIEDADIASELSRFEEAVLKSRAETCTS